MLFVLILFGFLIIGSFEFCFWVDFVCIFGVIKLCNGEYILLFLYINIDYILVICFFIIEYMVEVFELDIFIVDKELFGLCGEVLGMLEVLKFIDICLVLGLCDVMDDLEILQEEWDCKNVYLVLEMFYDEIWVYGLDGICNLLEGFFLVFFVYEKLCYIGYLCRELQSVDQDQFVLVLFGEEFYIFVMFGGGGDGVEMVDWVMCVYEIC